jgi:adenine deaminase
MIEKTLEDVRGLVRVSVGEQAPDLVISDTTILDVFTGTLFKGHISVCKSWIAYVGKKMPAANSETRVVDGRGLVAVPGYVDAHGHADLFYNPSSFADFVVTRGSTTVFSDGHDMVNSIGIRGFTEVLKAAEGFVVKYLWGVPTAHPAYPEVEGDEMFSFFDVWKLFSSYKECVSVSELSPYTRILRNEESILEKILMARTLGKNVEGHTLGASFDKLNALVASGITSCHESTREADLLNRIRLGLYTMVRHSSIRTDLEALVPVMKGLPKDRLILVSDGIFAYDLCEKGYMDFVLAEAIRFGLEPVDAIRMATLNPATYFKLDGDIGSIAPGRIADILLLEDIAKPTPVKVIERGRLVSEEGRIFVKSMPFPDIGTRFQPYVFDRIEREEFLIPWKGEKEIPVIDIADRTVTRRLDMESCHDGKYLLPVKEKDVRKALYTRRNRKHWGKAFVRGIGADIGGIAMTTGHDSHGLLVLGFDDTDMAEAANSVLGMGGGVVLVDRGEVLFSLPLPHGATMSNLTIPDLAEELRRLIGLLRERGSRLDDPLWTICFLTFTSVVDLRITVSGIYDVKRGEILF